MLVTLHLNTLLKKKTHIKYSTLLNCAMQVECDLLTKPMDFSYYYRFIVHFLIELVSIFIIFCILSWTSSLSISRFAISASTFSNHVFFGLSTAFNSNLHTFLHQVLIIFPHHMSLPSQPTTSNDSCDRVNSNHLSQFFTSLSVFDGNARHPSNYLHLCSF